MEANGWLKELLSRMDDDIQEIKTDVKRLSEFKWRIAGGVTVLCALITFAINAFAIWMRH